MLCSPCEECSCAEFTAIAQPRGGGRLASEGKLSKGSLQCGDLSSALSYVIIYIIHFLKLASVYQRVSCTTCHLFALSLGAKFYNCVFSILKCI